MQISLHFYLSRKLGYFFVIFKNFTYPGDWWISPLSLDWCNHNKRVPRNWSGLVVGCLSSFIPRDYLLRWLWNVSIFENQLIHGNKTLIWNSLKFYLVRIKIERNLTAHFFFRVNSLAFSVTLYCGMAVIAIIILLIRRRKFIGGELGGPVKYA